jgi:two-component sensor histidine kinase
MRSSGPLASILRAGVVGLACAVGAIVLRALLDLMAPNMEPYPLVFPAVLLATLASGVGAGLVALVLGLGGSDFFFVTPRLGFLPENLTHGLNLTVTTSALLVVLWLAARYRSTMLSRAQERLQAEEHLRVLVREVDHRANNLLAVVQSIINLTKAEGPEARTLKRDVLGRVGALARAHQLLSDTRWRGAKLETLVEEELRPYTHGDGDGDGDAPRALAQGPSMPLSPAEAEAIAMAVHELATNAAKYGAFSAPTGRVEVTWAQDGAGERHIRWQEDGGPPVVAPDHQGLGTRLLERSLAASGGRTRLVWRPEGLVCEFDLPPKGRQAAGVSIDEQLGAP